MINKAEKIKSVFLVGSCGYIGSYLYPKLIESGFRVTACDLLKRGNPLKIPVIESDYATFTEDFLSDFDAVLWFGGHSSVSESINDPDGAIVNNCLNLFSFAKRLKKRTKLIYASTGSLYSTQKQVANVSASTENSLVNIPSQNAYDISKFAFDYLAKNFLSNFYGLRMGTLSGYSANLRSELVFNAMNISAAHNGFVKLMNKDSQRTILFLSDLWVFVYKLLTSQQQSGFYNVGSISLKIDELANIIAKTWGAKIIHEGNSETYSFMLDCTQMQTICGESLKTFDIEKQCRNFIKQYQFN